MDKRSTGVWLKKRVDIGSSGGAFISAGAAACFSGAKKPPQRAFFWQKFSVSRSFEHY
jgi:hypothetical protein